MHKIQFALWTCIALFAFSYFNTNLSAQLPLASPQDMDHTPQSEFFPVKPASPSPSVSPQASTSPEATPQPSVSPATGVSPQVPASSSSAATSPSPSSGNSHDAPPQQIDLSQFPATAVDEVVVPLPSEIFNVLDKVGTPNWREELPATFGKNTGDRAQVALLLGSVIANGFIAVELEDTEKVKDIGREVLNLAEAINVRKAVIARSKSITDKADAKDWNGARKEFDGALQDVRTAMQELNDNDLAQLVSLGGWLRGTEVLTSVVKKDYNPQVAELLHQPELMNYFLRRIDSMPRRLKRGQYVSDIRKVLLQIRPLALRANREVIPKEDVEQIYALTHNAVQLFTNQ